MTQSPNRAGGSVPSTDRASEVRYMTVSAVLAALALVFTYVEVLIPYPSSVPGVKAGLANIMIIIALYRLGPRYALVINLVRMVLAGLLFTGIYAMIYSLAGGILSFLVMWGLKRTGLFSMIGVSMAGGAVHNLGQVAVAALMISSSNIFLYYPVLLFTGIAAGIMTGIIAYIVDGRLPDNVFQR